MPSYLTTSDVATRLGVSLDTVRRWLRSGELKGTPFGRAGYRIEDADFQAFLQQRRRQPRKISISSPEQYALSNAALEELINAVGQELRTPLTTTRGALQQARRLLQSALESPMSDKFELSLAWCNLVEIVRETVTNQQELPAQGLFEQELPVDDLVAVIADADRIRQALTNYLTNALKFSPADQPIKIYLEVSDAEARVTVQDKGPGIPDSEQGRIWERFQQGQRQPVGSGGGLGLGLYITRTIIHQHRGQVGVESHSGEGSTFWFTLPLADETWHY